MVEDFEAQRCNACNWMMRRSCIMMEGTEGIARIPAW